MAWNNTARPRGSLMRRLAPWLVLAFVTIALDQLSKLAILKSFGFAERKPVIAGLFDLTLLYNKGAAFSFLAGASGWQREFFTAVGVIAALLIVWLLAKHGHQKLFATALALIMGGAIGNVIDRLMHGHVVDFLLFYWRDWYWPAFNVADSAIVCGAALLIVDELLRVRRARA
ncbi:signal peptidase II [soil metagenome]